MRKFFFFAMLFSQFGAHGVVIRKAEERGFADLDWLKARYTFSFAEYRDSHHMGYGILRVINEDRIAPGQGFSPHPHKNMEIITYIIDGALAHKDSGGNHSVVRSGEVQLMSAGKGVTHSEFNSSSEKEVHLLQIWLFPKERNTPPSYEQKAFSQESKRGKWCLIASPDGRDGSLSIGADATIVAALLDGNETLTYSLPADHKGWVHIVRGSVHLNEHILHAGDGAAINTQESILFTHGESAEILLFDMY